ncbi:hypothetical protein [Rhodococcus opacus]|uniref:hypothetical protein n=1 Tax=Rhodococcus opacus TaxID=37919 RepID=UPI0034D16B59
MLLHAWPGRERVPPLELSEVRAAIAAAGPARFLTAVRGREVDDALQQVAAGLPMALKHRRWQAEPVTVSVINRLTPSRRPGRCGAGRGPARASAPRPADRAGAAGRPRDARHRIGRGSGPVVPCLCRPAHRGEVYDESSTDPMLVGQDAALDVEAQTDGGSGSTAPDLGTLARHGRRRAAAGCGPAEAAGAGDRGIGAFGRFRDLLHWEGLADL